MLKHCEELFQWRNHHLIYCTQILCDVKWIHPSLKLNVRPDSRHLIHVSCCLATFYRAELIGCFFLVMQETMSVENCEGQWLQLRCNNGCGCAQTYREEGPNIGCCHD